MNVTSHRVVLSSGERDVSRDGLEGWRVDFTAVKIALLAFEVGAKVLGGRTMLTWCGEGARCKVTFIFLG